MADTKLQALASADMYIRAFVPVDRDTVHALARTPSCDASPISSATSASFHRNSAGRVRKYSPTRGFDPRLGPLLWLSRWHICVGCDARAEHVNARHTSPQAVGRLLAKAQSIFSQARASPTAISD
jgi:hypothetical protein